MRENNKENIGGINPTASSRIPIERPKVVGLMSAETFLREISVWEEQRLYMRQSAPKELEVNTPANINNEPKFTNRDE